MFNDPNIVEIEPNKLVDVSSFRNVSYSKRDSTDIPWKVEAFWVSPDSTGEVWSHWFRKEEDAASVCNKIAKAIKYNGSGSMIKKEIWSFVYDYRLPLYCLLAILFIDHFLLNNKFRDKLLKLVDRSI